jgi:phosphatidylglycerophosphatase A
MSGPQSDILPIRELFRKTNFIGKLALCISTWFSVGLIPKAPGTFGTIAALPLIILIHQWGDFFEVLFVLLFMPFALWSSDQTGKILGGEDPQVVVVDEVAGFLLALLLLPRSWSVLGLGFILFRLFDIWKPYPIRRVEKIFPGGWGIVLDDLVAGLYANCCLRVILYVFY